MNAGIFFAMLTALSWAICIFPFTIAARRLGSNSLNHFRLLFAAIILALICIFSGTDKFIRLFSNEYISSWLWLGLSGIVGLTIGDYFAFTMYKILGARTGSILNTFAPAATLFFGALMIDEKISIIGISGIAITIFGVNFISFAKSEREKLPDHGHGSTFYGIIAGILAALCQGAGLVLAKKGMIIQDEISVLDPLHATFIRLSVAIVSLLMFSLLTGNIKTIIDPLIKNNGNGLKYAVAGTLFGPVLGVGFALYAVNLIETSVAQTIFSLVPVLAFLISIIRFKEKVSMKFFLGILIAILGVIVLIWRWKIANLIMYSSS